MLPPHQEALSGGEDSDAAWAFGSDGAYGEVVGNVNAGQRLGPFKLLDVLGRGGMGVVYRAREVASGREVALKVLLGTEPSEVALERFRREGEVTAALDDPGVVVVHTAGVDGGCPYIAYELVEGAQTLGEAWKGLSVEARVRLVRDVAQALGRAHAAGVVHRDVKPDNVLVDSSGRVRISDFGLASLVGAERLTQTGHMVGTPLYMSPEQLSANEATPSMDTWSLGVVLYEGICDALPFSASNAPQLMGQIASGVYVSPLEHNPDLPEAYAEIVSRALAHDPVDRYQDAGALARDLDLALESKPLTPRGRRGRPRVWRRHVGGVLAGGASLILLSVALTYRPESTLAPREPIGPRPAPAGVAAPTPAPAPDGGVARRVSRPLDEVVPGLVGELGALRATALSGDPFAQVTLAWNFLEGIGVPRDRSAARALLLEASAAGNGDAFRYLADMALEDGDGAGAVSHFEQAARAGNAAAWIELGRLLESGDAGAAVDRARAVACFQEAADAGLRTGISELGRCKLEGVGGPPDREEGLRLLRRAARLQSTHALIHLGRALLRTGDPGDREEAFRHLRVGVESRRSVECAAILGIAALKDGDRAVAVPALRFGRPAFPEVSVALASALLLGEPSLDDVREAVDAAGACEATGGVEALVDGLSRPTLSVEVRQRAKDLLADRAFGGAPWAEQVLERLAHRDARD